jgi:inhibitor of KinA
LPESLATPRLATPRRQVPAGSVGIAGAQTGVYPIATPGGWRLIGRTPWRLFDPAQEPMSRLKLGDQVRFRCIDADQFRTLEGGS